MVDLMNQRRLDRSRAREMAKRRQAAEALFEKVRFAVDSPLEGGVSCELVSEMLTRPLRDRGSISVGFGMFRDRKNAISRSNFAGNCTSFPSVAGSASSP